MRRALLTTLLVLGLPNIAFADRNDWQIYSNVDLFAYSEPVSVEQFAKDFDEPLKSGDTAFTHDAIELGVKWRGFRVGFVQRFDYVTSFTPDTALVHHADANGYTLPQNREYDLMLDVERLHAKGLKLGYTFSPIESVSIDISGSWYSNLSDLQSGRATAKGDLEPITDQLIADAQAVLDGVDTNNKDISALYTLAQDINATIGIDYAYNKPVFHEKEYRKPAIVGDPNPVISGVDFSAPDGTGYSFDLSVGWQVNDRLHLQLTAMDIANKFTWKNAPQTIASLDLNPTLVDAIGVTQDFINGEVVRPNDIVDRHLSVNIFNADHVQRLPHRQKLDIAWSLDKQLKLWHWQPNITLLGSYYNTKTQDFVTLGVALNDTLQLQYNVSAHALGIGYSNKYFFAKLLTDRLNLHDAHTIGIAMGFNLGF